MDEAFKQYFTPIQPLSPIVVPIVAPDEEPPKPETD